MDIKAVIEALGITKEDVLERAAHLAAEDFLDRRSDIDARFTEMISARVDAATAGKMDKAVDSALNAEMERLLCHEYTPVDLWGEATGEPTTLRTTLHDRAKNFWNTKVDAKGERSSYGGKPRYEWLFQNTVAAEFRQAFEQNVTNIIGGLKDALKDNAHKQIDEHVNQLIKVATASDKQR